MDTCKYSTYSMLLTTTQAKVTASASLEQTITQLREQLAGSEAEIQVGKYILMSS